MGNKSSSREHPVPPPRRENYRYKASYNEAQQWRASPECRYATADTARPNTSRTQTSSFNSKPKVETPSCNSTTRVETPSFNSIPQAETPSCSSTPRVETPLSNSTPKAETPSPKNRAELNIFRLPDKINTQAELLINWLTWKEEFDSYRKGMLSMNKGNDINWVLLLLNRMGPVGQNVYESFTFIRPEDKNNIHIVLKKFDCHVIFGTKTKNWDESVDGYIQDLREMVANKYTTSYQDELIKEKISQEFDTKKLVMIPFNKNMDTLTLPQVINLWKRDLMSRGEIVELQEKITYCSNCAQQHTNGTNHCPAYGQQCRRCKEFNHFATNCSSNVVKDCDFCGYDHMVKRCPAYGHLCTKCNRTHHFEMKCRGNNIFLTCKFCGHDHVASRRACPASDHQCSTCGELGHFPSRCSYMKR